VNVHKVLLQDTLANLFIHNTFML